MKRQFRTALYSSVALAAFAASVPVIAQEITSSIRGSVVDASGNPLSGVTVTVTHVNSGARSTFTSNNSGAFLARGLRPGGPYTVEVAATGDYQGQKFENLFLNVSEPLPLTIPLASAGAGVEEIEIVASRIVATRTGGSATYGSEKIEDMASVARDLKDTIRANPFVSLDAGNSNAVSIGGANNRFNSLTVDGIRQDDDFGLNANGYPTQRSPISVDAVEQVGVAVAPFGVEFNRFTGGQINVVTKSGTNDFHGTAFYQYRDDSLAGDKSVTVDGEDLDVDLGTFENKFWGATLGGPIIKDKLFFFGSYEKFDGSTPNTTGATGSGAASEVRGVTQTDLVRIDQIASSQYGIDNMFGGSDSIAEEDEKIFFKLDWNINENHRAFGSYQYTNGNSLSPTDHGGNRYAYLSHWYNRSEKLRAYNFQVFSDWTDNFSTEVKVGYKKNITGQVGLATDQGIGEIQIDTVDPDTNSTGTVYLGIDDSRHSNALNNETWQAKIKADYVVGDHTFTGGYELDSVDVFNLFIQRTKGIWFFDSIDDFEAGTPSFFQYQNASTNNPDDGAAQFALSTHTLYAQDRWDVNDKLTLTGGIRVDFWKTNDAPALNQAFVDRNGFANTATLDGKELIQPRFAFSYDLNDKTTLRGGVGRFGGGDPLVWVSNAYSLDGVTILSYQTGDGAIIDNPDFTQVPTEALNGLGGNAAGGDVAAIDPDFKIPSVWKFNLAMDRYVDLGALGDDWHFTLEAIWARTQDAADWKELRRAQIGTAADGTAIYSQPSGYDILLTNGAEGKQDLYAISFDKDWDNGLSLSGSYTYMDAEMANEGTSSTASSNYNFAAHLDRNDRRAGTSAFEIKHQAKLGMTYKKAFWGDNFTTMSLFYSGRSGKPFSITMDEFLQFGGNRSVESGDGHLLYVPTVEESAVAGTAKAATASVVFSSLAVRDAFNDLVKTYGLKRGQSVDLQSERGPWINDLDLHLAQEVPVGFGKVELFLNMENVLNFLNSKWGEQYDSNFAQQALVDTRVNAGTGQITYTGVDSGPFFNFRDTQSVWVLQVGAKYKF